MFSLSGISSLATSPTSASDYLYPLLGFAAAHVPQNKHKETPLYILCTAGMRLLPERYFVWNSLAVISQRLQPIRCDIISCSQAIAVASMPAKYQLA